jgi:hypothetical protein
LFLFVNNIARLCTAREFSSVWPKKSVSGFQFPALGDCTAISIREYARHCGVSHTAVRKAMQAGRIQQEADGGIDLERADAAWANNTRSSVETPRQPARQVETLPEPMPERQVSGNAPSAPDYNKARAVKEFYAARLAKLEFEEREGKLVNIDEINVQHFNRSRRLRDRLIMMLAYSGENEIVYEPFSGSGSSLLAGERCNRLVRAAEIAPEYVDVAVIRFTRALPDIPAILQSTGQTFEEVRHERQPAH